MPVVHFKQYFLNFICSVNTFRVIKYYDGISLTNFKSLIILTVKQQRSTGDVDIFIFPINFAGHIKIFLSIYGIPGTIAHCKNLPPPLLFNRHRHLSPRVYSNGKKLKGFARDPEFGAIFGSLTKREVEIKYCSRCSAGGNASGIIKRPSNRGRVRRMPRGGESLQINT